MSIKNVQKKKRSRCFVSSTQGVTVGSGPREYIVRQLFWSTYHPVLEIDWIAAPLAWLYAVPLESFLTTPQATAVQLAIRGIVSVWRVSLMTRVVSVYFGVGLRTAFCLVMLFVDTVGQTVLHSGSLTIFPSMGGIPLPPGEPMIRKTAIWTGCDGAPRP